MPTPGLSEISTTTLRNRGAKSMPVGPTKTKAQKQAVVHTEMHKFKHGELHSGSKKGPIVKNRKQAIAIAMSESGQSKPKPPGHAPRRGGGESKKGYDRSGHQPGNPGFGSQAPMPAPAPQPRHVGMGGEPHRFDRPSVSGSHGYGHPAPLRHGALRMSGHGGAHRIGKH